MVAQEARQCGGEPVIVVNAKARGAPAKTAFVPKGYSKEGGERQVCDWCASTVFARENDERGEDSDEGTNKVSNVCRRWVVCRRVDFEDGDASQP